MRLFEAKGEEIGQDSAGSLKLMVLCHILIPFHPLMRKDLQ